MPTSPVGSDPDGYAAQLRGKGMQIDAGAAKSVRKGTPDSNARYNGWERGITGEHRPGGGFMPYMDANGDVIKNKAMSSGKFDKAKERLRQRQHANT